MTGLHSPNCQPPVLVPLSQCAAVFGLSRSTIYRTAADGLISLRKIGSSTYIVTATALAFIEGLPVMKPRGAAKAAE